MYRRGSPESQESIGGLGRIIFLVIAVMVRDLDACVRDGMRARVRVHVLAGMGKCARPCVLG